MRTEEVASIPFDKDVHVVRRPASFERQNLVKLKTKMRSNSKVGDFFKFSAAKSAEAEHMSDGQNNSEQFASEVRFATQDNGEGNNGSGNDHLNSEQGFLAEFD